MAIYYIIIHFVILIEVSFIIFLIYTQICLLFSLKEKIIKFEEKGHKKSKRLIAHFEDRTGALELVWFKGIRWIRSSLKLNTNYIVFGKPSFYKGVFNIVHPDLDIQDTEGESIFSSLQPVYHSTELLNSKGLNSRAIGKLTKSLLPLLKNQLEETLSDCLIAKLNLPSREDSLFDVHHPKDSKSLVRAQKRLKFEEFFLQLHILKLKLTRNKKIKGYPFEYLASGFNNFYKKYLPFELTNAQKRVVKEIRNDVRYAKQMNRLLQGDVGSGKTLVAFLSMLMAVDNNYQACLMAPTEILAQQHYKSIAKYLEKSNIKVALLTGSKKIKDRKILHEKLENGDVNLLIGTHALLEEKVKFKNLGIVIIDEQHRFGVAQRAKLWKKNVYPPHILVMTATPIPRTLSMTVYGDLDVSIIDELPPGRKRSKNHVEIRFFSFTSYSFHERTS